ncbi:MAG TPA: sulfurtransferase complex subunit TusC [Spongiibacteraceae bacterium]|nr:sulfurtransferase complex subunit TusC [Spongiibacteraceae bacterium]
MNQRRLTFHLRSGPFGTSRSLAGIDAALAAGAFDQTVQVLLSGDGVLLALAAQEAQRLEQKSPEKILSALPLYDIDALWVDAQALRRRGLGDAALLNNARALEPAAFQRALADADHVLSF